MSACRNPFVCYNCDCLFTGPRLRLLADMQDQAEIVLASSALRETCTLVMDTDFRELIPIAARGLVFRGSHGYNEGDYLYSLLFMWLVRRAEMMDDDLRRMMRELLINHPEAVPCEHTEPDLIWNVHGTIIRCMLSICNQSVSIRHDRSACHLAVRSFADSWNIVMQHLNLAFVPEHYRPETQNVIEQMIAAIGDRCVRCSLLYEQCLCTGLIRV